MIKFSSPNLELGIIKEAKPFSGYLNKNLIMLMEYLKVPKRIFLQKLTEAYNFANIIPLLFRSIPPTLEELTSQNQLSLFLQGSPYYSRVLSWFC